MQTIGLTTPQSQANPNNIYFICSSYITTVKFTLIWCHQNRLKTHSTVNSKHSAPDNPPRLDQKKKKTNIVQLQVPKKKPKKQKLNST